MAYTNAQLARREAGDPGIVTRDLFSGDGSTTAFYLRGKPVLGSSYAVRVAGTLKTDVTDYALDLDTGRLVMATAPAAGTDNLEVLFKVVEIPDADVTEVLRVRGLDGAATADVGPASTLLLAAADLLDWRWSNWVGAYDVSMDGESLSRGKVADAIKAKAEELRTRARQSAGLTAAPVTIIDGYNRDEVTTRDVNDTTRNPRRRYYGQEDRIP